MDFAAIEINEALKTMSDDERRRLAYALSRWLHSKGLLDVPEDRGINLAVTDMVERWENGNA